MRIDAQNHTFPLEYARFFEKHSRYPMVKVDGNDVIIDYNKRFIAKKTWEMWAPENSIKLMDDNQIDMALLSPGIPCATLLPGDLSIEGARIVNEELVKISAKFPGRFKLIGFLPWNLPSAAIEEAKKLKAEGFIGVMLCSHIGKEDPVDLPVYRPIYKELAELGLVIFIHPMPAPWADYTKDYDMNPMMQFMVWEGFTMMRLIMSGIMEQNPKLRVVHPHCGGILPALAGRIWNQTTNMGRGMEFITIPPLEILKSDQVWYDTVSPDPVSMRFCADFLGGTERLMFATDSPWVNMPILVKQVQTAFPGPEIENVWSGAAKKLLGI